MINTLEKLNSENSSNIIYYVIKLLNKSLNGPDVLIDVEKIKTDLDENQLLIANELLIDIDFRNLDEDNKINEIISELLSVLMSIKNSNNKIDIDRGKMLLTNMRE